MALHTEWKVAAASGKLIQWRRDGEQIVRHMMTQRMCYIQSVVKWGVSDEGHICHTKVTVRHIVFLLQIYTLLPPLLFSYVVTLEANITWINQDVYHLFQMKPARCTLLRSIFQLLYMFREPVSIIRRIYFIYATLVLFTLYGWLSGRLVYLFQLVYMFRAAMCPSSGELTVSMRHWYYSLCTGGCLVGWYIYFNLSTCFGQLCAHHQGNLLYLCDTGIIHT